MKTLQEIDSYVTEYCIKVEDDTESKVMSVIANVIDRLRYDYAEFETWEDIYGLFESAVSDLEASWVEEEDCEDVALQ